MLCAIARLRFSLFASVNYLKCIAFIKLYCGIKEDIIFIRSSSLLVENVFDTQLNWFFVVHIFAKRISPLLSSLLKTN